MIAAGKSGVGNAFAITEQAVGVVHFGSLFPLADGHAGFSEEHSGKRFSGHTEVLAPFFDGKRFFDIFEEVAGQLLKLMTAGHDDAYDGTFGALDDIPDDKRHAVIFLLRKVELPVMDGENEFSEKGSADDDMAGMEALVVLEE